jgi:hypothetical protein
MADWILLALVGSATYLLLQKSVARLSKVPWRILWLVMMMPPLIWVLGRQVFQYEMPPPCSCWGCFWLPILPA